MLTGQDASELYQSAVDKLQAVVSADSSNLTALRAAGLALLDLAALPGSQSYALLQACTLALGHPLHPLRMTLLPRTPQGHIPCLASPVLPDSVQQEILSSWHGWYQPVQSLFIYSSYHT